MNRRELTGQVVASLRALSTDIDRLDHVAAGRYGLNRTDMRALDIVGRAGPLAPSGLAQLMGFTTGGVTTVIDRLERAGYARRQPDPADRRRQIVAITEATTFRDQEVFGSLIRQTAELLSAYTDEQLQLIDSFLNRTQQLTASYADGLADATKAQG